MSKKRKKTIEELVPNRSLWTCIPTGSQIIVTRRADEWVDYLCTGSMGIGGMALHVLLDKYVMAGEGCTIEAHAQNGAR